MKVSQDGKDVHVGFGKIGANGQATVKSFDDEDGAAAEVAKLIREKTKKGYHEATPPSE